MDPAVLYRLINFPTPSFIHASFIHARDISNKYAHMILSKHTDYLHFSVMLFHTLQIVVKRGALAAISPPTLFWLYTNVFIVLDRGFSKYRKGSLYTDDL